MMLTVRIILVSFTVFLHLVAATDSLHISLGRRNIIPKFPYDGSTTKYCGWWLDNDGSWTCGRIEEEFELSMVDFHEWVGLLSVN